MSVQNANVIQATSGYWGSTEGIQVAVGHGLESDRESKEVYKDEEGGKHAYSVSQPPAVGQDPLVVIVGASRGRKKWFFIVGAGILIIIAGMSIAVGLVVSRNKNHDKLNSSTATNSSTTTNPSSSISAPNPAAPSIPIPKPSGGVPKGTRLTMMDTRTNGEIYLFYQWDDGGLRYIAQSSQHTWEGSSELHVTDAKLGTPLASWWLFYVDNADVIQNIYSANDSTTWQEGNVGSKRYQVPKETNIAFTASNGIVYNYALKGLDGGISLYASGIDGTIHEYIFDDQNGSWNLQFTFPDTNGFSGAATWSTFSNATLYTASSSQTLELWYRDYDTTASGNSNGWQLGPSSHADLMQNGSICGQWGIAFQSASGLVQGSNFTSYADPEHT